MTRRFLILALAKLLISSSLVMLPFVPLRAQGTMADGREWGEDLLVVFWNVENLFDCDGKNGGEEWTPEGGKHWTSGRLRTKCNAIGKTLLWIGEQEGRLPDIVGLAEVENAEVLRRLIYSAPLRKAGYRYVRFGSPDPRGIDVALLYSMPLPTVRPKARQHLFCCLSARRLPDRHCRPSSFQTRRSGPVPAPPQGRHVRP